MRGLSTTRTARLLSTLGALGVVLCCSTGCTLVGLAAGSVVDSHNAKRPPRPPVEAAQATKIAIGTSVAVVLENGKRIEGKYAGVESVARSPEYDARYAQARERLDEPSLPALGQRVVVSLPGRAVTGAFAGLQAESVLVQPDGEPLTHSCRLNETAVLAAEGAPPVPGARVQQLIADRKLPVLTRLVVGRSHLPFDQVRTVEFRRGGRHSGTLTGLAVGLALDAAVIVSVNQSLNDIGGDWGSGPLLVRRGGN